jgi:hypothetical protein
MAQNDLIFRDTALQLQHVHPYPASKEHRSPAMSLGCPAKNHFGSFPLLIINNNQFGQALLLPQEKTRSE